MNTHTPGKAAGLPRSFPLILLLAGAAVAAAGVTATGGAAVPCADPRGCPDLAPDALDGSVTYQSVEPFAATHCAVVEGLVDAGTRTLLRFPLITGNVGRGDVVIGMPSSNPTWFENSTCHGHQHFQGFAAYRLWTPVAYAGWTAARALDAERPSEATLADRPDLAAGLVAGRKQGFCLMDTEAVAPFAFTPNYPTCGWQGLSVGWQDRYDAYLDGQWIDVTGLASGQYVLETEVNPARRIAESSYANNAVAWPVYVE